MHRFLSTVWPSTHTSILMHGLCRAFWAVPQREPIRFVPTVAVLDRISWRDSKRDSLDSNLLIGVMRLITTALAFESVRAMKEKGREAP